MLCLVPAGDELDFGLQDRVPEPLVMENTGDLGLILKKRRVQQTCNPRDGDFQLVFTPNCTQISCRLWLHRAMPGCGISSPKPHCTRAWLYLKLSSWVSFSSYPTSPVYPVAVLQHTCSPPVQLHHLPSSLLHQLAEPDLGQRFGHLEG